MNKQRPADRLMDAQARWDRRQDRRRRFTQYRYVVTSGAIVGGAIGWMIDRLF